MSCSGNGRPAWRYGRIPRRRAAGGALLATPSADRPKRLCERQRLEPSLTQLREAKAGAFAYTTAGGKGWNLRLQLQRKRLEPSLTQLREAKAGAFAYNCGRQRREPSLTTAGGKGGSLRLHNCGRQRL